MLVKGLIFATALMIHIWLWGQWSLEKSMGQSLMLVGASLLFVIILVIPFRSLMKSKSLFGPFKKMWFVGICYLYFLLVLFMAALSFTGLIQYLLPIKLILIGAYAFLKFKLKKKAT